MVKIFLAGDVMLGRGVDQILPCPASPQLFEDSMVSATDYVALAELAHGPIPRHVGVDYVWGDALACVARHGCDRRIVNLETAVTTSDVPAPKGINYRTGPRNAAVLNSFAIDCCALANNHVLDWGRAGLNETIETVRALGIATVGAGRDQVEAAAPAVLEMASGGRILVFSAALPTSGVPASWAARRNRPGVFWLEDMSKGSVEAIRTPVAAARRPGDVTVLSLHWGPNWGYDLTEREVAFAHALIEGAGIDILHGHSSHHPKPIELYRDRLILYGCGDFINDYEGIRGYEQFRGDIVLGYVANIDTSSGNRLASLDLLPFRIRKFRLERTTPDDTEWLRDTLLRISRRFGTAFSAVAGRGFSLIVPGAVSSREGIDNPP